MLIYAVMCCTEGNEHEVASYLKRQRAANELDRLSEDFPEERYEIEERYVN